VTQNERIHMLERGPIGKTLYILSYPAVIGLFSGALYNIVDTLFIGLLDDTAAIGASAVIFPILLVISTIGLGFGIGAASAVSRLLGAKRSEDAQHVASTAFYSAMFAGLLFSIFGLIFIEPLLIFFGATESILGPAREYGSLIIGGSVLHVINMCMNNIIRSEGAASYSGKALLLGSGLNILLDPVFMFLFGLGIRGAGVATIAAQGIAAVYLLRFFVKGWGIINLKPSKFLPKVWIYAEVLRIGVPTFIRQALVSVNIALLNQASRAFGDAAIAGIGVVTRIMAVIFMVSFGIGQGLQPLAGYNYGAGQYERVRQSFKIASISATLYSSGMAILFFLFAQEIVFLFSRDPEVISIGSQYLQILSCTLWLLGFQIVGSYLFQALGKGKESLLIAMSRQGLFFIPLILILPGMFGLTGVYFVQPLADFLSTVLTLVLVIKLKGELYKDSQYQMNQQTAQGTAAD